jgi:hypothetical protein
MTIQFSSSPPETALKTKLKNVQKMQTTQQATLLEKIVSFKKYYWDPNQPTSDITEVSPSAFKPSKPESPNLNSIFSTVQSFWKRIQALFSA